MRVSYSAILAYRRTLAKVRPRATPGQHVVAAAVLPRHQPVIRFYAPTRTLRRKPPKKRSSNPGAHRYSRRDVAPAPEGGARQPQALPGNRRATSRFEPVSGSEDGGWRCDGEYRPPRTLAPGHRGYQEGHRACDRRSDDAPCRIEVLLCSGASNDEGTAALTSENPAPRGVAREKAQIARLDGPDQVDRDPELDERQLGGEQPTQRARSAKRTSRAVGGAPARWRWRGRSVGF